ncbi:SAM-dependent methyltransferase [candidate division KSB3 bacterium]|uniref:SAM-dependent methyltransferase n=1 Tax=candidate division KSB3 bacterium TaxID=2044937 RepID=A0A2G6KGW8_9BACT|nr:MAG: SAM-dependent methyltransferase [candidate division KSB3 bacterium]
MKIYLQDKKCLAFFEQKATSAFWDAHWETKALAQMIQSSKSDPFFLPQVKKYLSKQSLILEGGCGRAQIVHALVYQGYKAIGIDFAEQTVKAVHRAVPELDVGIGDVFHLPFKENSFDGYISAGVIEHFWEGYDGILKEMQRIIKPGGVLFLSFPCMSFLRKVKAFSKTYRSMASGEAEAFRKTFYQFALNWRHVASDCQRQGFRLIARKKYDGLKGFKDEFTWFKPLLQPIYDGQSSRSLRSFLNRFFTPLAYHCILLVLQNK